MKHLWFQPDRELIVRPLGLPATSWWTEAQRDHFTETCQQEYPRMAVSRIGRSLGLPMVIGQLDGKGVRQ
jgi:hypothetical protein